MNLNAPDVILQLLEGHNISCDTHESWCVPNGELPAIRTVWTDGDNGGAGRLDVEVLLADERRILECFAGLGSSPDECQKDALQNFLQSSFHVLLSAIWGNVDSEQVDVETWTINDVEWNAHIGGFTNRASTGVNVVIPESYFEQIVDAIRKYQLNGDTHWFRTYFCNIGSGERIHEALADNSPWIEGEEMMKKIDWASSEGFYSIRNFIVLKRARN